MAAKVFDLSSYLEEQKATIKLGEKTYEVSDGFNDLLKIDALSNRREEMEGTEFIQEFLKISLGEEAANELLAKNYSFKVYAKIMDCIQQVYSGDEETEGVSQNKPTLV